MDILVVGAGAMGRWFAAALVDGRDAAVDAAFADSDSQAAQDAADEIAGGRAVRLDTDETFDAVCIAVPIPAAATVIATHAERADLALVDVTGVAEEPIDAMREHGPDRERLSLHPLFAPENAPGNVVAVADEAGPITDAITEALTARGNRIVDSSPEQHDAAMETVQARVHAAILAFGLAAEEVPDGFQTPVSAALFDLVDQVAGGDSRVYADIQEAFDGADDVAAAARDIADADPDQFETLYRDVGDRS